MSGTSIQRTGEDRLLIRTLVRLDGFQRQHKAVLFEYLYELWTTDGLISENIAKRQYLNTFVGGETI